MRNRYLDLLRAAAIVRVVVYHLFGWPWLSILLPAMGIMFALAGSLTAASLDRRPAGRVITSRLRRLLPPLWLLAAVAVPAMLYLGWRQEEGGDEPLSWKLGLWLLPVGDPPGSQRGIDVWEPLWYIRAYLWFVLLSPLLYRAYKKIGWAAVVAPLALIAILDRTGLTLPFGRADAAMWDFATYGACWIAGFAHHDGRLARVRPGLVVAASSALGLLALYWLRGHAAESGWDLNDVPESQALWSLAVVLLVLRWQPDLSWLERTPRLDGLINLLNARAVTIYLWHNIAIAAIWPVLTVLALDDLGGWDGPVALVASLGLTVGAVLAFGWAEDVAAGRRVRLWPAGVRAGGGSRRVGATAGSGAGSGPGVGSGSGDGAGPQAGSESESGAGSQAGSGSGSGWQPGSGPESWDGSARPTADLTPSSAPVGPVGAVGAAPEHPGPAAVPEAAPERPTHAAVARAAPERTAAASVSEAAPWAGAGAVAPIVLGDGGLAAQRRDRVAPFPEAEVTFGLPQTGAWSGRERPGGNEGSPAPGHDPNERAAAGSWFGGDRDEPN